MKHLLTKFVILGMTLCYAQLTANDSYNDSAVQKSTEETALETAPPPRPKQIPFISDVNASSFHQLIVSSTKPIVLIFSAEWCGPCKKLKPILEEIAAETPAVVFVRANYDTNRDLASNYGVKSIPTVVYMLPGGKIAETTVGLMSKQEIVGRIHSLLNSSR